MPDEIYLRSCEIAELEEIREILKDLEDRVTQLEAIIQTLINKNESG
ncbi:MAG: hypothetical protein J7J91_04405 [Deltaproteobacteria bacterium]|nr:hypothetical protein [Deltaproteobacteria bacterium]